MMTKKNVIFFSVIFIYVTESNTKDYCRTDYCNNSKQHTLCKYRSKEPASHCTAYERTISSKNERQMILDKINSRRNKVAAGEIRSLPPAESMLKLEWNKELEMSAQRWADQCVKHSVPDIKDTCRDLGKMAVGQNIATIHGDSPGLTPLALVDVWYMELLHTNLSILSRYVPSSETGHSQYDYFTQLVWEKSNQVGCGGVKFKERLDDKNARYRTIYRLVCNFAPSGNRRNKTVYSSGPPCSRCPSEGVCDPIYTSLCTHKQKIVTESTDLEQDTISTDQTNSLTARSTQYEFSNSFDNDTENTTDFIEVIDIPTPDLKIEGESIDYFSHLYDFTRQTITSWSRSSSCKDIMIVDDFVKLLKKKLSNDPLIKELLSSTKSGINGNSETTFDDDSVAAFVDTLYSKREPSTTKRTVASDYVNSTFLVDLIEAVIFRNGDKMPVSEGYSQSTLQMSTIEPVMIQAELAEVKQNEGFTGHYFFPEEDEEEISREATESYYDNINLPVSDLVLEDLRINTVTKDFLEDILESDTATESTTALPILSPDKMSLYKSGHGVMKKFLQTIVDKSRATQNYE